MSYGPPVLPPLPAALLPSRDDDSPDFLNAEDQRLVTVMQQQSKRLPPSKWAMIAHDIGAGENGQAVQERWNDFLAPSLDRRKFSIEECRAALYCAVERPTEWKHIATRVRPDRSRSPAMVCPVVAHFVNKANQLGFELDQPEDVRLLPDVFFLSGFPGGEEGDTLRQQYNDAKTALAEATRAAELRSLISGTPRQMCSWILG